jgi:drug/metabolite transporter (DMT)-like permease
MFIGIFFVISACFFWGFIFVVPQFMAGYSPLEVAMSRYLFYGIFSCVLIFFCSKKERRQMTGRNWAQAFWFGLLANILYYPCLVCSIRFASPVIATLIFGLSPIAIALYGNWKQQECSYGSLIIPALCIVLGLGLVNLPALQNSSLEGSLGEYCSGIAFGLIAVGLWTYYAVANAAFLKKHPYLSSVSWATIVGVATFAWVFLIVTGYVCYAGLDHTLRHYIIPAEGTNSFVIGGLLLGILSTWVGIYCWNKGSGRLPVTFAGQLTVFETIFGLLFVFILEGKYPSTIELSGAALMLSGVITSIHAFKNKRVLKAEPAK